MHRHPPRLLVEPNVERWLATAGLISRIHDITALAFQDGERGLSYLGRETVDEDLVDSVVPDPGEVARALAAGTENVGGGRGKRAKTEGEDASSVPQASRLTGALRFSDGAPGTGAADYDELYRELAREYLRRFAPRGR